jgi:hypothetical protein
MVVSLVDSCIIRVFLVLLGASGDTLETVHHPHIDIKKERVTTPSLYYLLSTISEIIYTQHIGELFIPEATTIPLILTSCYGSSNHPPHYNQSEEKHSRLLHNPL